MEFPGFLGNDQLKASLSAAVDRRRAAHFYLLSGPAARESERWPGYWRRRSCARIPTAVPVASAAPAGRFWPAPIRI